MSDLAAPLLAVLQDEADAFWCFAALMERLQSNFDTDCSCAALAVARDPCRCAAVNPAVFALDLHEGMGLGCSVVHAATGDWKVS